MSAIIKSQFGVSWIQVFYHDSTISKAWFNSSSVEFINEEGKYSILCKLESFRIHGYFEFLLEYPEHPGFNRWKQTSNPTISHTVTGYSPIGKLTWTQNNWNGLALSSDSSCFIDGSPEKGDWYYSIGQYEQWIFGSLAGPIYHNESNSYTSKVYLWCRIPVPHTFSKSFHIKGTLLFLITSIKS